MNECDGCVWKEDMCGIISHPDKLSKKYQKNCICKHCILKVNCSEKCNLRTILLFEMISEIDSTEKK